MIVSPPSSPPPEGGHLQRPQSMYAPGSPETWRRQRPQSMINRTPRSLSRMSAGSRQGGGSRASDEECKTSVKVAVRVRPPLQPSDPGFELIPQRFRRPMVQVNTSTSLGVDSPQGRKIFIFDRVFGEDVTQRGIWDYLQDSVDSFLQGYNVSILAYGQSGAGKSYTMGTSGSSEQNDPLSKGIIPRAAAYLFENLNDRASTHSRQNSGLKTPTRYSIGNVASLLQNGVNQNFSKTGYEKGWELSATYVEIYNEHPRDLLLPDSIPLGERANMLIREDPKGRIYVEGLRSVRISTVEDLLAVLNYGSTIRQTDATALNAKSSRSHAIFTLNLRQTRPQSVMATSREKRSSVSIETVTNGDSHITVESKLHFVDLAGSERMKNTGATGDRAREGISINAGLASLGKVISQLSSRSPVSHVSYRDSKLTRILQDSLGGNAITYMIACVTPAEFHLSETLNTVQYAQRARNIQSKPKIQQISDDSEKQAIIDRLRTEIAFLRQQIRSAEGGERRSGMLQERSERHNEREVELHNQLLDLQESYTALSQRHAKLISGFSKSGETNGESQMKHQIAGESAVDRLKRSQAHQEQIEEVVMEYEKTIQSLELNLSTTRSSLARIESSLLERETKCAYVETVNQQLHSRVQKLMDREANTETYLQDLETKLEGLHSGDEDKNAIVADLHKEIARIRESEANAEDYISTLEERLAEADQDMELMQRELERLDHLVERQRSLGKLDNLLYELDHIQRNGANRTPATDLTENNTNGFEKDPDLETLYQAAEIELPPSADNELSTASPEPDESTQVADTDNSLELLQKATVSSHVAPPELAHKRDHSLPNPAQTKYIADKFESVSQELFDLRLEHESTINELDLLSAKYQEALRTLAEMQDAMDEGQQSTPQESSSPEPASRPTSFLEDARMNGLRNGGHLSSSRSHSSELSSVGESATSTVPSDITLIPKEPTPADVASEEIDRLRQLLAEHERGMNLVTQQYAELQAEHKDTIQTVAELKLELQRNKQKETVSPANTPVMFRRMTSQIGTSVDRGQRAIVSLRSIAADEFENRPDRLESMEVHLSAASHELQARMERIQALESETKNVKKEMEMKSTIISGLTRERERNSLKVSSPVDLSMVSQMRDQLIQKETELKSLHDAYAAREQEFQRELQRLSANSNNMDEESEGERQKSAENDEKLKSMKEQLEMLSTKHQSAEEMVQLSQRQLTTTVAELEAALASIETLKAQQVSNQDDSSVDGSAAATAMQNERDNYRDLVDELKRNVEEQRSLNASHRMRIAELETIHSTSIEEADEYSKVAKARDAEIAAHRSRIAVLEEEAEKARSAIESHKLALKSLKESHADTIEDMKQSHASAMSEIDTQLAEVSSRHETLVTSFRTDVDRVSKELQSIVDGAQTALGHPTTSNMLINHIQDLAEEKKHIAEANARLARTNAELERQLTAKQSLHELEQQLANLNGKINNYQITIRDLANEIANNEETLREKDKLIRKHQSTIENINAEKKKKTDMVEELEQQLQNSFDQHNNRVSMIQAQGNQALIEAQQRIASLEKDLDVRKSLVESDSRTNTMKSQQRSHSPQPDGGPPRSNSMTSNLRKTASVVSLPSPPPAIPLPPLPSVPGLSVAPPSLSNPSPPQSRHTSREVSSLSATGSRASATSPSPTRQSQLLEEQDSRIRTIEKHLHAEKQLTATLEEALVDLETQSNKLRADMESWKKKAWAAEEELQGLRKERRSERMSLQAMEEEKSKRREAEAARAQLEERMKALNAGRKKRKGVGLNCF